MTKKLKVVMGGVYEGVDVGRFQSGQYADPDRGNPKLPLDWKMLHVSSMRVAAGELELAVPEDAPPAKLLEAICRGIEPILLTAEEKDAKLLAAQQPATVFNKVSMYCARCHGVGTENTSACPFCGSPDGKSPPKGAGSGDDAGEAAEVSEGVVEVVPPSGDAPALPTQLPGTLEVLPQQAAEAPVDDSPFKAALARLRMLQSETQMKFYDIGVELRRIRDEELWKAGGYPDFRTFMVQASGLSTSVGYRLVQVADEFSREDFQALGIGKLRIIASLEDGAQRQELLEAARNGASTRTLANLKEEREGGGSAPEREREEKPAAPAVEPTVALLGRVGGKAKTTGFRTASDESVEHGGIEGAYVAVPVVEGVELHVALKLRGKPTDEVRAVLAHVVGLSHSFVAAEE